MSANLKISELSVLLQVRVLSYNLDVITSSIYLSTDYI